MKKIFMVVLFLAVSLSVYGDVPKKMFGVTLGDDAVLAVRILKGKGTLVKSDASSAMFRGISAFGKSCTVLVQFYEKKVVVIGLLVPGDTLSYIDVFNSVYNAMIKKYGTPTKENRDFNSPYRPGDGYTSTGIRAGKIDISNAWGDNSKEAFALLKITTSLDTLLAYYDSVGYQKKVDADTRRQSSGI